MVISHAGKRQLTLMQPRMYPLSNPPCRTIHRGLAGDNDPDGVHGHLPLVGRKHFAETYPQPVLGVDLVKMPPQPVRRKSWLDTV